MCTSGRFLCSIGWIVLVGVSLGAEITIFGTFINSWPLRVAHIMLFLLSGISYYRAITCDAGPVRIHKMPMPQLSENLSKICTKCDRWKPPRAHHCRTCRKCVFRMDHHCVWINNCVASHNQKYFILFNLYTLLISLFTLTCQIYAFTNWPKNNFHRTILQTILIKIFGIITILLSVFFSLFTGFFLYDQLASIVFNSTSVEQ